MLIFRPKVFCSDEVQFHLDDFVNRQNCHIQCSNNPLLILERQMNQQRVTVWCGFQPGGLAVIDANYRDMKIRFIVKLQDMNVHDLLLTHVQEIIRLPKSKVYVNKPTISATFIQNVYGKFRQSVCASQAIRYAFTCIALNVYLMNELKYHNFLLKA